MGADLTAITEALASRLSATRDLALPKAEAFVAEHVVPLIAEREAKAFREGAEWLAERIDSRIAEARREGAAELAARTQLALDDALAEQHATKAKSYSTRTFLGAIARISNDLTKPPAVSGEPT